MWFKLLDKIATHSGILAGEYPWTEDSGGLQSMACTELDMAEQLSTAQHLQQGNLMVASSLSWTPLPK